mmetsp:Transcript_11066/g.12439  ORF Transcript_11066/g.12439 Transcript_11066/m.12439 type:complete len:194 (-) Transcript_11066:26-607(-)
MHKKIRSYETTIDTIKVTNQRIEAQYHELLHNLHLFGIDEDFIKESVKKGQLELPTCNTKTFEQGRLSRCSKASENKIKSKTKSKSMCVSPSNQPSDRVKYLVQNSKNFICVPVPGLPSPSLKNLKTDKDELAHRPKKKTVDFDTSKGTFERIMMEDALNNVDKKQEVEPKEEKEEFRKSYEDRVIQQYLMYY